MLRKNLQAISLALVLAVVCSAQTVQTAKSGDNFAKTVGEIATGSTSEERSAQIREELEKAGVKFSFEDFTAKSRGGQEVKGRNLIAEIPNPKAKKTLLLGAHYDKVSAGKGAIDNASGAAAILELLKAFKEKPLQNFAVKVAFWDKEEVGLVGSREFIKARGETDLPAVYINFDVFGYGDTIWLWTKDEKTEFSRAVADIAAKARVQTKIGSQYPPSDHLSFAQTKVESYSFSLIGGDEIPGILKVFGGEKLKPEEMPRVLQIIHSNNDTMDKIDANAVAKNLSLIEQAIRSIDK